MVLLAIIVVGSLAGALIWPWPNGMGMPQSNPVAPTPAPPAGGSTNAAAPGNPAYARLPGRWLRTDSDYVIEIAAVDGEGQLQAKYFNPRPIKVAKAIATVEAGTPVVFVELQDIGYPGSTYRLNYSKEKDSLQGEYYQAAMGQTFAVEFLRTQ